MAILTQEYIKNNRDKFVLENVTDSQFAQNSIDLSLGRYIFVDADSSAFYKPNTHNLYTYEYNDILFSNFLNWTKGEIVMKNGKKWVKIDTLHEPFELIPNLHILAYTDEWVGSKPNTNIVWNCLLKSTAARVGIDHALAGFVESGYFLPLCLEIETKVYGIKLGYGDLIAQAIFNESTDSTVDYTEKGSYQSSTDLEKLKKEWVPEDILPKRLKKLLKSWII